MVTGLLITMIPDFNTITIQHLLRPEATFKAMVRFLRLICNRPNYTICHQNCPVVRWWPKPSLLQGFLLMIFHCLVILFNHLRGSKSACSRPMGIQCMWVMAKWMVCNISVTPSGKKGHSCQSGFTLAQGEFMVVDDVCLWLWNFFHPQIYWMLHCTRCEPVAYIGF